MPPGNGGFYRAVRRLGMAAREFARRNRSGLADLLILQCVMTGRSRSCAPQAHRCVRSWTNHANANFGPLAERRRAYREIGRALNGSSGQACFG
jgi:hypothetical protein